MKIIIFFIILCFSQIANAAQNKTLPIIVSIAPQKWLVEQIAGDTVSVTVLVTPGADPHSYEPTPQQMKSCSKSVMYFTIGVPFEDIWVPKIRGSVPSLSFSSMIRDISRKNMEDENEQEKSHKHIDIQHHEHGVDPHVWLSAKLLSKMVPATLEGLTLLMPERALEFKNNADKLISELQQTDLYIYNKLKKDSKSIMADSHFSFLTFHPAWGYYAEDYGLHEISIEIEGKEPGPRTIKKIIDEAKEHNIKNVFIEPQFPKSTALAIANNINAKVITIDILRENPITTLREMTNYLASTLNN